MRKTRRKPGTIALGLTLALGAALSAASTANAAVTVFVGEPFGSFGAMMPTGHTTIYLDRVCADGPLKLRMCRPGEPAGVAIARYDHLGQVDWVATPILDFLYATQDPGEILPYATPAAVATLRETYRKQNLETLFPDGTENRKHNNEWVETIGVAYDRRLYGYQLATSAEQDEAIVANLNARANRHAYHLHKGNCADFAADLLDLYFPGTVKAARVVDFGIMSPKQVARSVARFGAAHPEANLQVVEVDQVPGTLRRSRPARFGSEMLLKQKRYVFTLAVIQPEAVIALAAIYLDDGRWKLGKGAQIEGPEAFETPSPTPRGLPACARSSKD